MKYKRVTSKEEEAEYRKMGKPYTRASEPIRKTEAGKYDGDSDLARGLTELLRPGTAQRRREKEAGID